MNVKGGNIWISLAVTLASTLVTTIIGTHLTNKAKKARVYMACPNPKCKAIYPLETATKFCMICGTETKMKSI